MTTSEQSRADAIADAETLRWYAFRSLYFKWDKLFYGDGFYLQPIDRGHFNVAYERARCLAHHAFDNVPGLRGSN